jgi:hypothetical protein
MRNLKPILAGSILAASFSTLAFAQDTRDNTHYNIHQKGEQNTSQTGDSSQSNQVSGSDNTTSNTQQSGTQNQSATGSGNQQSQQSGSGNNAALDSGPGSASAGASSDSDRYGRGDRYGKSDDERHDNGKHKGWSKNGKDRD